MSKEFNIKGDEDFSKRVKTAFKDLIDIVPTSESKTEESQDSSFVFSKPKSPPRYHSRNNNHRQPRVPPSWKKDPSKFTKYDLSDVEVSSDKGNTRAAFSFLSDIRKRNASNEPPPADLSTAKFSFKKPRIIKGNKKESSSSSENYSKQIMPEVHVGEIVSKKKPSSSEDYKTSKKTGTLKLSHLQDDEEEEESDN
ncbi:uncharacterized protein [Lepeophtheirus salmonis]|uniref:uncharacterized protein n=1 Tax=Lepeophtheirus salmonis TaxID=72036 RepID=UPI001AEA33DD|nr:uncharacterized protein LOC121116932 isoform X1 [Lepeophtheirus salmonis]